MTPHLCIDNLTVVTHEYRENHGDPGPGELISESWEQCRVCGEKYSPEEVDQLPNGEPEWPALGPDEDYTVTVDFGGPDYLAIGKEAAEQDLIEADEKDCPF